MFYSSHVVKEICMVKISLIHIGDNLSINPEMIESVEDCSCDHTTFNCVITMATGNQHKMQSSFQDVISQIKKAFETLSKMS